MAANPIPMSSEEQEDQFHDPDEKWSDSFALKTVKRDFAESENYLIQNHYQRWLNADRIYTAWSEQKTWEGTKIPRATASVWLAFEQIESLLPYSMSLLFGGDPIAEAVPYPGSSPEGARVSRDYIISQFEDCRGERTVRKCIKSAYIYGDGIAEAGWETLSVKRTKYRRVWKPITKTIEIQPGVPQKIQIGMKPLVKEKIVKEEINRPFLRYISLRDFTVDPNCESPDIQEARYITKRCFMTVDDLDALRDEEDFDIPSIEELMEMSNRKTTSQGDQQKTSAAAYRAEMYQPSIDKTSDPAGKRIEVIQYNTHDRLCWMLNREHLAYNAANKYRDNLGNPILPFFHCYYTDVLDRFFGLAITDILEWDQRLIVSLLEARLNELALNINPPRMKQSGRSIPAYQLRRRPGATIDVESTRDTLVQEPVSNVTQQVFTEVTLAEIRAQKSTGASDLAVLGSPSAGGNAASRTATGSQIQSQASGRRHTYQVETAIEEIFMEPIFNFFAGMNRDFLDPNEEVKFLGPNKEQMSADPLDMMNTVIKFKMRSGDRARSKAALQQMMPLLLQTLLNPQWLQLLAQQQNMTVDIEEFDNLLSDSADAKPRGSLFRQLTPQEKQAMNPPPQPDPTKVQLQQERLASQSANVDTQVQGKLAAEAIKQEAAKAQMEADAHNTHAGIQATIAAETLKGLVQLHRLDNRTPGAQE